MEAAGGGVPGVQRPPPHAHLSVPGAPAVLAVLVRGAGVEPGETQASAATHSQNFIHPRQNASRTSVFVSVL